MNIGYSFWGFLFQGVVDTPDGGRITRLPFLKALIKAGANIVCLQTNRDLEETSHFRTVRGITFNSRGTPPLDALIFEYRWPIPGRNTLGDMGKPGFTPDLIRQQQLLDHYSGNIPLILWDKDLKLDNGTVPHLIVAESALAPRNGNFQLLFSFDQEIKSHSLARLDEYSNTTRTQDIVYIGNQYEREDSFMKYINRSGMLNSQLPAIYGNWTKYPARHEENLKVFPHVCFHGRLAYSDLPRIYQNAFSTVLIAPERYYKHGQITQRMFECLSQHVVPFVPSEYRHVGSVVMDELLVSSAEDVVSKIRELRNKGDAYIRWLLGAQIRKLACYAPHLQAESAIGALTGHPLHAHKNLQRSPTF